MSRNISGSSGAFFRTESFGDNRMTAIQPRELVPGPCRGQKLVGRVCGFDSGKRNTFDFVQFYLVASADLDGSVLIEAWREHARSARMLLAEGCVVEIKGLIMKVLGDRSKWQSTPLSVFGSVNGQTSMNKSEEDYPNLPFWPGTVLIRCLPDFREGNHLLNIVGIIINIEALTISLADLCV